jgi:hypothetical protein
LRNVETDNEISDVYSQSVSATGNAIVIALPSD